MTNYIATISIRTTDELKERLERLAEQEHRSVSRMVNVLLLEALEARRRSLWPVGAEAEQEGEGDEA